MSDTPIDSVIDEHGLHLGVACRCGGTAIVYVSHAQLAEAQHDLRLTGRDAAQQIVDRLNLGLISCGNCREAGAN